MLERADKTLEDAHYLHFERKSYESAVSRAYYAMYYATEACLLSTDQTVSSHKGLIAQFGKHFVKTGFIEPQYGRMLANIYQQRQLSDYEVSYELSESESAEAIVNSGAFIRCIRDYLKVD
ncbi:HEPN domain-containing protein [Spirosoma montaniterrae]|uniref:HEPN domain-containing protein n=1 Tax=Spirosoma montaniterrae TaxID=1178516 RepID=UPI0018DB2EE1|nr:HEPN domain-containing protein [Spirosoma montaniterrae]